MDESSVVQQRRSDTTVGLNVSQARLFCLIFDVFRQCQSLQDDEATKVAVRQGIPVQLEPPES